MYLYGLFVFCMMIYFSIGKQYNLQLDLYNCSDSHLILWGFFQKV